MNTTIRSSKLSSKSSVTGSPDKQKASRMSPKSKYSNYLRDKKDIMHKRKKTNEHGILPY